MKRLNILIYIFASLTNISGAIGLTFLFLTFMSGYPAYQDEFIFVENQYTYCFLAMGASVIFFQILKALINKREKLEEELDLKNECELNSFENETHE